MCSYINKFRGCTQNVSPNRCMLWHIDFNHMLVCSLITQHYVHGNGCNTGLIPKLWKHIILSAHNANGLTVVKANRHACSVCLASDHTYGMWHGSCAQLLLQVQEIQVISFANPNHIHVTSAHETRSRDTGCWTSEKQGQLQSMLVQLRSMLRILYQSRILYQLLLLLLLGNSGVRDVIDKLCVWFIKIGRKGY